MVNWLIALTSAVVSISSLVCAASDKVSFETDAFNDTTASGSRADDDADCSSDGVIDGSADDGGDDDEDDDDDSDTLSSLTFWAEATMPWILPMTPCTSDAFSAMKSDISNS